MDIKKKSSTLSSFPKDVLNQITYYLQPKEVATVLGTCKSLKVVLSDDKIWERMVRYNYYNEIGLFTDYILFISFPLIQRRWEKAKKMKESKEIKEMKKWDSFPP